ncbi:MAG: hypothetical protein IKW30_03100 [Lachnospiraceae bacterium]|nr:hypothetical protein [Lachnospiraceae bacterium]
MNVEYNTYMKVVPETDVDREVLERLMEQPGQMEELEEYISEIANTSYKTHIYTNYKGINLILEKVTALPS